MTWELTACPFCGGTDIARRQASGLNDQQCESCWGYWSEGDLDQLADRQVCPRRQEAPAGRMINFAAGSDFWRAPRTDHPGMLGHGIRTCSYCGSMHPDDFMERARTGIILGTTSKSYKVYVRGDNGDAKFYWMHLSEDQRREFVDLYNARQTIAFEGGFGFAPLPFFMARAS